MAGKGGRKKNGLRFTFLAAVAVLCLIAFSLTVRWFGFGRSLADGGEPFQVEVLNGTGEPGIAGKITLELRKMGIDVLKEGNAGSYDFRESLLIDRKNNPKLMKKLSRLLGCKRVIIQVQEHPDVDATIIIGWDREKLKI